MRKSPNKIARALAGVAILALTSSTGCVSLQELFGLGNRERPLVEESAREARIEVLEAEIETDHAALEDLVSGQRADSDDPLHKNEALRTIAERLTLNEEELEALRRAENPIE